MKLAMTRFAKPRLATGIPVNAGQSSLNESKLTRGTNFWRTARGLPRGSKMGSYHGTFTPIPGERRLDGSDSSANYLILQRSLDAGPGGLGDSRFENGVLTTTAV